MASPSTQSYPHVQNSTGPQTNPTTATILADTGVLPGGIYQVFVLVGCSVAAKFSLEHRNASNDANVSDTMVIRAAAGQTGQYAFKFSVNHNERLRIAPQANITGEGEASLQVFRIN
jgi:hypothetical protein